MTLVHSHAEIKTAATIQRVRPLPRSSIPKVAIGQPIPKANDLLAAAEIPEQHRLIRAAEKLHVAPEELEQFLQKREGDIVERGNVLASRASFLGLLRRRVLSPVDGRITRIADGKIVVEGGRRHIKVLASVPGHVVSMNVGHSMVIETSGTLIEAAWGHGGLGWGTLKTMDDKPGLETDPGRFNINHRGAIVAIGSPLTEDFIKGAVEFKVKGVIAASMHGSLIPLVRQLEFPVILTQGFGRLPMDGRILDLLSRYAAREVALVVETDRDWRESRPAIIIPLDREDASRDRKSDPKIKVGGRVRILQAPHLGEIGTITALSDGPQRLASGLWLPGVFVDVPGEETIFVPFVNLQYLG